MLKIIHSFDIKRILKFDTSKEVSYSFIILNNELSKYSELLRLKGLKEINVEEIGDEERRLCEKEYINGIAELSYNHQSIEWWANPVSEKNEHLSPHYKNLCLYYSLIKTLKKNANANIYILIVCNNEIFEQLKIYCNHNNIKVVSLEKPILLRLNRILKILYTSLRVMLPLIKALTRKIFVHYTLKFTITKESTEERNYYVLRSWLNKRFFAKDVIYNNAYFGRLSEYIVKQGYNVLLLAGIVNDYIEIVRKIKKSKKVLIIPEEYFLKYSDFFRSIRYLFKKIRLTKRVSFSGLDVTELYEKEILKGCFNPGYISNILRYFIAKNFAQAVKFSTYVQTFENYTWEKMTILGIRETQSKGKILGFQHAFISRNSFKYFPGEMERDIIPLPDRIITRGKITKDIMEKYGYYKPDILKIGCALRQEYLSSVEPLKRRCFNKVVVPLTMVQNESALIMKFLYDSGLPQTDIKVIIRCHPEAPFKTFKKHINFRIPDNFVVSNEKSVHEELLTTDIVLYTWTTVAVEAAKMGLPVIYLDILRPMYVDPLFECSSLKRTVRRADELLLTIQAIYNMSDADFYNEQALAQEYLMKDFYPVTEENLNPFISSS